MDCVAIDGSDCPIQNEYIYGETVVTDILPSYSGTVAPGTSGPYYCPATFPKANFTWRGHKFRIDQPIELVQHLYASAGIPRGKYRLSPGPHESVDDEAIVYSGFVEASCFVRDYRTPLFELKANGYLLFGKFTGDAEEVGGNGTSGGSKAVWTPDGWVVGSSSTGYSDADAVLDRYFSGGGCTYGWALIVDAVVVCSGS